jgi:hypothetical protein
MPDPVNTVITDITQVEKALESLVKPGGDLTQVDAGVPQQPVLQTIANLLTLLYKPGNDIASVGKDLSNALVEAAHLLNSVASTLKNITTSPGATVAQNVQALQNALATAQAIMPGAPPVLASGSQFFGQITTLLNDAGNDVTKATNTLYEFAQQLYQIGQALMPH